MILVQNVLLNLSCTVRLLATICKLSKITIYLRQLFHLICEFLILLGMFTSYYVTNVRYCVG